MTGTWVLYLPHIKTKFGLNDIEIGVASFCLAFGLLISISFVPAINKKLGVGQATRLGILFFALSFNLPLLAPSYVLLCSSLLLVGIFSGFTDIAMNALVSTIERNNNQNFMSAAHGFFSLGGFIGAGIGSILISVLSTPSFHMGIISAFVVLTNFLLAGNYIRIKEEEISRESNVNLFKSIRPLLGLAIVGFIIMFNEGAVEYWSNLFFFDVVGVVESMAGYGFIAFSLCMTLGRFLGDGISSKIGSVNIISLGSFIALIGYGFIISTNFILSVVGFGILGLGLSVVVPELFRLAGQTKGVQASVGISLVSGMGFAGFLLAPVILGLISNWAGLTMSYVFLGSSVFVALGLVLIRLRGKYTKA